MFLSLFYNYFLNMIPAADKAAATDKKDAAALQAAAHP